MAGSCTSSLIKKICFAMYCLVFAAFLLEGAYFALKIFPEVGLFVNSQCNSRTPGWDGVVLGVKVNIAGYPGTVGP
jgi:hypothetical protein